MQPTWHDPTTTPEGELLQIVKQLESQVFVKNKECSVCKNVSCSGHGPDASEFKPNRGDEEKPKLPKSKKQKHNKPKKGDDDKPDFGKEGIDKTAEFFAERGIITKYQQEPKGNTVPTFMDHTGGTPVQAVNYSTNQVMPHFEDAPSRKNTFISEKAKIPSVSQTGYDEKGSSLHQHLNDGGNRGDGNWNIAPVEETLTQLKKAGGYGNPGIVEEIAVLIEQVAGRLQ